jgi:hypothetical protein
MSDETLSMSGVVTQRDGSALAGVRLTLRVPRPGRPVLRTTSADGRFDFSGLAAGTDYTLTPRLASYKFDPPDLSYTRLSGRVTDADFTATRVVSISGTARKPDDAPIPAVVVDVTGPLVGGRHSNSVHSGTKGQYLLAGLIAGGDFTVGVALEGYNAVNSPKTLSGLGSSTTLDFVLEPTYTATRVDVILTTAFSGIAVTLGAAVVALLYRKFSARTLADMSADELTRAVRGIQAQDLVAQLRASGLLGNNPDANAVAEAVVRRGSLGAVADDSELAIELSDEIQEGPGSPEVADVVDQILEAAQGDDINSMLSALADIEDPELLSGVMAQLQGNPDVAFAVVQARTQYAFAITDPVVEGGGVAAPTTLEEAASLSETGEGFSVDSEADDLVAAFGDESEGVAAILEWLLDLFVVA